MLRFLAFLFGLGFLALGVLGFMPDYTNAGILLKTFEVDLIQNVVHIVSGVLGISVAFSRSCARFYFQLLGLFYGIVTILGFVLAGDMQVTHVNMADNVLNLGVSAIALFLGFILKRKPSYR